MGDVKTENILLTLVSVRARCSLLYVAVVSTRQCGLRWRGTYHEHA